MQNVAKTQEKSIKQVQNTTCCIVGAGPAGAILALLLARQGISVHLLEAHMDFDREFRGDTIHSSVLTILDELGLAERLLQIPHTLMSDLSVQTDEGIFTFVSFKHLKTKYPYIAMIPQVKFLAFITNEARAYPDFHLVMGAQVDELIEESGKVVGVRYRGQDGEYEVRAALTVGADGRFSRVRKLAGFEPIKTSSPMDILWFRLSRRETDPNETFGRFSNQTVLAIINRGEYWQMGFVIPKGHYQQIRAAGLPQFRQRLSSAAPELADRVDELHDWKQISVLSVESSRIPRWYRSGLLLIGDAAHVMSPVGGVGINYAIQDGVVTSNVLNGKLRYGIVSTRDLAEVQRQRELPTRLIQTYQNFLQRQAFGSTLESGQPLHIPMWVRLLLRVPLIRDLPARIIAIGFWPAHVVPE